MTRFEKYSFLGVDPQGECLVLKEEFEVYSPPAVKTVEAQNTLSRIVISPGQPVPTNMMEQEDYQNTRSDAAPFFTTTVDFVSYEVMMLLRMKSVNSRNENYVSDFCSTSQEVYLPQSFC